jgi:hypothetical protein
MSSPFHLAAIVQNLKTLANYFWWPWLNVPAACLERQWRPTVGRLRMSVEC